MFWMTIQFLGVGGETLLPNSGKNTADEKTIATYMLLECWKDEGEHVMLDE